MMKAETKAKRRVTLAICGLGFLDESEVDSIKGATQVVVNESGEVVSGTKEANPRLSAPSWPAKSRWLRQGLR